MLMYHSVGVYSVLMIMDFCVLCLLFFPCTGGASARPACPFSLLKGPLLFNFGCKNIISFL